MPSSKKRPRPPRSGKNASTGASDPSWTQAEKLKWEVTQQALGLTRDLGRFVGRIVGPAAVAMGGLLGDQMKAWRAANLTRIALKWRKICSQERVPEEALKALPFRDAVLVLEAASMEDDDSVQELWAQLMFRAAQLPQDLNHTKMHVDILESLNGVEAKILMHMFAFADAGPDDDWQKSASKFNKEFPADDEGLRVALLNLQRLGIIAPDIDEIEILGVNTFDEWRDLVTDDNLLPEFQRIITNLVVGITNLSGNPMNDRVINKTEFSAHVTSHGLTRIGWSLYRATDAKGTR